MTVGLNQNTLHKGWFDLAQNELRQAVVQVSGTAPATPVEGQIYHDSVAHKFNYWNGTVWVPLSASGAADVVGAAASTDGELPLFSLTTGKVLKRSNTLSGVVKLASGVVGVSAQLGVADGGTGAATLTGLLKGNGTSAITGAATLNDAGTPTGNFGFGGFKITGIGLATAGTDVASLANKWTDFAAPSADVNVNSQKIINVANGTGTNDAVNFGQLSGISQGVFYKAAVKGASTGNLAITALVNGLSHDGVTYATGDRILLKDQTAHQEDGIYTIAAATTGVRATDADVVAEMGAGATVFVDTGTVNGNTQWTQTATLVTLGTTPMAWVKIFQPADLAGLNVTKKYTALIGNGSLGTASGTPIVVTHNLGLTDRDAFTWSLFLVSSHQAEGCEIQSVDTNSFNLWGWTTAPASNAYRVTVVG